jgi:hypothetical protein
VRKRLRGLPIGKVVGVTIGLVIALGIRPVSVREILAAYVLALTAIALITLARLARTEDEWERSTSELAHALAPRHETRARPAELVTVERDLTLGTENAGHFHARLRPLLWSIAAARVRDPRDALAEETWELLQPDRPPPAELYARGPTLRRLGEVVDELETL